MTNKSFKKLLAAAALVSVFTISGMAFAESTTTKKPAAKSQKIKPFYVSNSESYLEEDRQELCRQVANILNEPENKKFADIGFIYGDDFVIPTQKYPDFSLPIWEDIKREDLTKYAKSESWLDSVKKYEEKHPDPKEQLIIQKTTIDLDNDGAKELVLRFGGQYRFMFIWSIFVSDIVPTKLSTGYIAEENGVGKSRNLFRYKGKTYIIKPSGFDSISIARPMIGYEDKISLYGSCYISLIPPLEKSLQKKWHKIEQESSPTKN